MLLKYITLIQNNQFIEAHSILEHLWKEKKKSNPQEAKILKGFINGATALALKIKGKDAGAIRVWGTYEKYEPLINEIKSENTTIYKKMQKTLLEKKTVIL